MIQSSESGQVVVSEAPQPRFINILQEFSIPLLGGVAVAMVAANTLPDLYHHVVHWAPFGDLKVFGHHVTHHWLVNDVFMVLFFGIAAKEITESCLPGGSLNPISRSFNPLMATLGGVVGRTFCIPWMRPRTSTRSSLA